jgi:hypothetical protein
MRVKFTQMRLSYSTQAKSLRQTAILYVMRILAYERLFYTKRRSANAEKQYIYMMRVKLKAKDDSIVLLRLGELVSVSLLQKTHSVNTSWLYKIKSFKWLFQRLKKLVKKRNGKLNVNQLDRLCENS